MRSLADALAWARRGTELVEGVVAGLAEAEFSAPSELPGWSRRELAAHVAANADALRNLVRWAATGTVTPMYASAEDRAAGIAKGLTLSPADLRAWTSESARLLAESWDELTPAQWQSSVVTAQGRTVPAAEVPWLRAREVCVHAVDFGAGVAFADLPTGFLTALAEEAAAKRAAAGGPGLSFRTLGLAVPSAPGGPRPVGIVGDLPEVTAYLTGRATTVTTEDGTPVPVLGAWL
jgi:maleylpyruvate isomerase